MTVWEFLSVFAGWVFYGAILAVAGGLFVTVLYAILRAIRLFWRDSFRSRQP